MAFVIGFATDAEIATLRRRGWEVELADDYDLVAPPDEFVRAAPKHQIVTSPPPGSQAVLVWVDPSLFDVMSGPDWEHAESASLVSWEDVPLYWLDGARPLLGSERIAALTEYRVSGGIAGVVLADPATEAPYDDACCYAGPHVDEIDWTGFPPADAAQEDE